MVCVSVVMEEVSGVCVSGDGGGKWCVCQW